MMNSIGNQNYITGSPVQNQAGQGSKAKLSLFYINDMHGNIDNMSGMIAASDKFDKNAQMTGADTLKISAGDNFSGGDDKKNQLVINLLARMGIDASAVGNHEFDSTISTFYKFINPDKTKFLAANAKTPQNSQFYNNVQKSTVVEVNGNKYGIIGLMPFDLETVTGGDEKKLEGIRPEDMQKSVEIVNGEAQKLTEQGVNKIILVSHIGNDKDKIIAPKLHGIDVIVGGHSHTEVSDVKFNENLFNNADNDPVLIVQTGENAKNVGVLNLEFDEKGIIKTAENNLIKTSQEKSPVLEHLKDSVMGKSPIISTAAHIDPLPLNRRTTPCAWTNFMCDAMRDETGSDIAFINAANTRKVPLAGNVTERDVTESTPLKNTLLIKQMTEKEIVRGIKEALSKSFSSEVGEPGILHASGLSYTANTNGELLELSFVDKQGNKTPIDINNPSDKAYRVCYDSFVAKGTEYPVFVPETSVYPNIEQTFDFDKDQLTIDYIKKKFSNGLNIKDDSRIKIFNQDGSLLVANSDNEAQKSDNAPFNKAKYSPLLTAMLNDINSNAAVGSYSTM